MIKQNAIEKKAYDRWLLNNIKKEKHAMTVHFEAFTDNMKDAFCEYGMATGVSEEADFLIFEFMSSLFEFESKIYEIIENSNMARKSLGARIKLELENPGQMISGRIL